MREHANDASGIRSRLAGSGSSLFRVTTDQPQRDGVETLLQFAWQRRDGAEFGIGYQGGWRAEHQQHLLFARARLAF